MRRFITTLSLWSVAFMCAFAQSEPAKIIKLKNIPDGIEQHGFFLYYYTKGDVYNSRSKSVCSTYPIRSFKLNPSNSSFVLLTDNKGKRDVAVYDLWTENNMMARIKKMENKPVSVCYTADARLVIVADETGKARAYDAITGRDAMISFQFLQPASEMKVSLDGRFMAVVHGSSVEVWNMQDRVLRKELTADAAINAIDFSEDGNQLAVLSADSKLVVYDTKTLLPKHTIDALGVANSCVFHPEGKHIAVVTGENRIALLNLLNDKERNYIDAVTQGISSVAFARSSVDGGTFLVYYIGQDVSFVKMTQLSPLRSKVIAGKVQELMAEWVKQLPGESLVDYQQRVNDETRLEQIHLFEQQVATEMALEEGGLAHLTVGAYNAETQMLSLGLENMSDIFISVPTSEVGEFVDISNLEFRDVRYGLNKLDEFDVVYAEIFNKKNEKTYVYNNTEGQFLDYLTDEASYTPLSLLQLSALEEGTLEGMMNDIISEAKEQNLITDHTHVAVKTHVESTANAAGDLVHNYEVEVAYTVDAEFSARDDYAPGRFKIDESNAGLAMLKIVKQALEKDFAKYVVPGKRLKVAISGTADASPIRNTIKYDGVYGEFFKEPIRNNGEFSNITVTKSEGIKENMQLGFLRAVGVKEYMTTEIPQLSQMQTDYEYNISVSEEEGSEHRKVSIKLIFEDAFDNK